VVGVGESVTEEEDNPNGGLRHVGIDNRRQSDNAVSPEEGL